MLASRVGIDDPRKDPNVGYIPLRGPNMEDSNEALVVIIRDMVAMKILNNEEWLPSLPILTICRMMNLTHLRKRMKIIKYRYKRYD